MKLTLLLLLGAGLFLPANSQTDTMLVYDYQSQAISIIPPALFSATVTSDHSASSPGSMISATTLAQTAPSTNVFSGSGFSKPSAAENFFNISDYPIRTCVNLRQYKDTSMYISTGMIVGPCFVLTSASCVYDFSTHTFMTLDSSRVIPAWNKGLQQPVIQGSLVKKAYLFKSFYDGFVPDNFALLELYRPIGLTTGWTGIGFDSSPNFTSGKLFHKFSYLYGMNPFDSSDVNTGDTLYYNYGSITSSGSFYTVQSNDALLLPGQGGSTFLYYNNNDFYSVGLATYSNDYYHSIITNKAFYQLNNILNTQSCYLATGLSQFRKDEESDMNLFPNPADQSARLEFNYDPSQHYELRVFNLIGQQLGNLLRPESGSVDIPTSELAPGAYLVELKTGNGYRSSYRMIVEH